MKKDDKFLIFLKELMRSLAISLVIVFLFTQFLFQPVRVEGMSMYPNLNDHELGLSSIITLKTSKLSRFDIVVIRLADKSIVKRIVGLPGETIEYKDGSLYVNGKLEREAFLENDYVKQYLIDNELNYFTQDFGPYKVAKDGYFVVGDNRINSSDSRSKGSFAKDTIKSKSIFILFPLNKIRLEGK